VQFRARPRDAGGLPGPEPFPGASGATHDAAAGTAATATRTAANTADHPKFVFGSNWRESGAARAGAPRIGPGSVIPVQLTKTIDAKKAKTGDEVLAKVTEDLKTTSGDLILPKDTKIVGHVTEAQARSKEQKESQLGIAFDRAVMKSGDLQLPMSIQAIVAPPTNNPDSDGGHGQAASAPGGAATAPMGGARNGSASASAQSQSQPPISMPTPNPEAKAGGNARPPITGNTQGVVGISNLQLETTAQHAAQGSLMSSEKNNVKLESGTFMLLRVDQ
jgi:hypothetical protein